MLPRPFRKHGVVPLAMFIELYQKGDTVDSQGMGTAQQRKLHKRYQGIADTASSVIKHGAGIVLSKQVRGRIIAKKSRYVLGIVNTPRSKMPSWTGEEKWQGNRGSQKKDTWVKLLFPENHTL